jgi:hypothetical protein
MSKTPREHRIANSPADTAPARRAFGLGVALVGCVGLGWVGATGCVGSDPATTTPPVPTTTTTTTSTTTAPDSGSDASTPDANSGPAKWDEAKWDQATWQ